jgi:hypothetical protein
MKMRMMMAYEYVLIMLCVRRAERDISGARWNLSPRSIYPASQNHVDLAINMAIIVFS